MPRQIPGFPGTFYAPGERGANATIVWRGTDPATGKRTEIATHETVQSRAQTYIRKLIEERGRCRPPAAGEQVALATVAAHYKADRKIAEGSDEEKRVDWIVARDGTLIVSDIVRATVMAAADAWHTERLAVGRNNRADTVNREVVTPYRALLHYAEENDWAPYRVIRAWKAHAPEAPTIVRAASDATVMILLQAIEAAIVAADAMPMAKRKPWVRRCQRALVRLVHERGYRIGEWLRLRWEWLDLPRSRGRMLITKPTPRWADFELSPESVADLAALKPRSAGHVFPWKTRSAVYGWVDDYGIRWRPHESRRAVVSDLLRATGDVKQAGAYVGHGSIKTTLRYRIVDADETAPSVRFRGGKWGSGRGK